MGLVGVDNSLDLAEFVMDGYSSATVSALSRLDNPNCLRVLMGDLLEIRVGG